MKDLAWMLALAAEFHDAVQQLQGDKFFAGDDHIGIILAIGSSAEEIPRIANQDRYLAGVRIVSQTLLQLLVLSWTGVTIVLGATQQLHEIDLSSGALTKLLKRGARLVGSN